MCCHPRKTVVRLREKQNLNSNKTLQSFHYKNKSISLGLHYCWLEHNYPLKITVEPVLKDRHFGHKNMVFQGRWSLVTGSFALTWRRFCQKLVVLQDRWALVAVVSQDRFYCTGLFLTDFECKYDTCQSLGKDNLLKHYWPIISYLWSLSSDCFVLNYHVIASRLTLSKCNGVIVTTSNLQHHKRGQLFNYPETSHILHWNSVCKHGKYWFASIKLHNVIYSKTFKYIKTQDYHLTNSLYSVHYWNKA